MPISPKLSRQLDEALGKEAAEELVNWIHDMDEQRRETRETLRADVAELRQEMRAGFASLREEMQAGFARSDVKILELRQDMQAGFATLRQEIQAGDASLRQEMRDGDAGLRQESAQMEARLERRIGDLIKWSFVFWVGAVGAIAMLARALG